MLCGIQIRCLETNLTTHTSIQFLGKKEKFKTKCSTSLKRLGHVESKFDSLNFQAKSRVKSIIQCYTSLKFMIMANSNQVLNNKFSNLYFHTQSQVKTKKYFSERIRSCKVRNFKCKVKIKISMKSYDHSKDKM